MINQMIKDVWAYFTNAQKIAFIALFVLSIILGLLIPVLLPNSSMRQIELSRSYVPGELSDEDVYSPQSVTFIDEIATERVRREASNAVLPYFSVNLLSTLQTVNLTISYVQALNMNSATSPYAVLRDAGIDDTDITNRILNLSTQDRNLVTGLLEDVVKIILTEGVYDSSELDSVMDDGYMEITTERIDPHYDVYVDNVSISSLLMIEDIYEYIINYGFDNYREIGDSIIILIAQAVRMLSKANVSYDALETEQMRENAAISTPPVSIRLREGDLIIARDTIITEQDLRIIDQINNMRVYIPLATLLCDAILLFTILAFAIVYFISCIQYKYRIPLYATPGTWQGIGKTVGDIPEESVRYVYPGSMTLVGGLCVKPFSIPHDAAEPVGYSVFTDNRKLTVATDIGCPTEEIKENIYDSDVLLLEANHDVDMLKKGSYPWALKKRILGERGHLSNVCAGQTLGEIMSGRLKYVFLGHLSSENNEPHLAFDTVRGILEETGVKVGKTVELDMASRYSNSRTIALGS